MAKRDSTRARAKRATAPAQEATKQTREQMRAANKLLRETELQLKRAERAALKEFRHNVSILKRQGILSPRYDARRVTPTDYLRKQLRQWSDVVAGKAKAARPSKELLRQYQAAGYRSKNGRVVVAVSNPRARLRVGKKSITEIAPMINGTVEKVSFPVPFDNVRDFLEGMRGNKQFNSKKTKSEKWAFQFYGRNSLATYDDIDDAIDDLDRYESIQSAIVKNDPEQLNEIYQNIVFYRVKRGGEWVRSPRQPRNRTDEQRRKARERRARREARRPEAERAKLREARNERKRQLRTENEQYRESERAGNRKREAARRAVMSDAEKAAYKARARERAAASRNRKKDS